MAELRTTKPPLPCRDATIDDARPYLAEASAEDWALGYNHSRNDIIALIERAWHDDCNGWRTIHCESCRRYDELLQALTGGPSRLDGQHHELNLDEEA